MFQVGNTTALFRSENSLVTETPLYPFLAPMKQHIKTQKCLLEPELFLKAHTFALTNIMAYITSGDPAWPVPVLSLSLSFGLAQMMTVTMAEQERAVMIQPEAGHREQADLSASIIQHECIIQAVREALLHTALMYFTSSAFNINLLSVCLLLFFYMYNKDLTI